MDLSIDEAMDEFAVHGKNGWDISVAYAVMFDEITALRTRLAEL